MKITKEFENKFSHYKVIETEDSTKTLYSARFDEVCHSLAGATEETLYNYILGCQIERDTLESLAILEIGMGPGIGIKTTFEYLESNSDKKPVHFVTTEIDPHLIDWVKENLNYKAESFPQWENLKKFDLEGLEYYQSTSSNGLRKLTILIGDALKTLPKAKELSIIPPFNAIYQDPFSPRKNSTLWTKEWFELLKKLSDNSVIMSTYSSATLVKKAMVAAGWIVYKREGFAKKRSATQATLDSSLLEGSVRYEENKNL